MRRKRAVLFVILWKTTDVVNPTATSSFRTLRRKSTSLLARPTLYLPIVRVISKFCTVHCSADIQRDKHFQISPFFLTFHTSQDATSEFNNQRHLSLPEMITIRVCRLDIRRDRLDTDIQKLLPNGKRIRISETLFSIFRRFRLLQQVAHFTVIHLVGYLRKHHFTPLCQVCAWCNLSTVV